MDWLQPTISWPFDGRTVTSRRVLTVNLLVCLVALAATAGALHWVRLADIDCETGGVGPSRVVALSLAGETDRLEVAARECSATDLAPGETIEQRDRSAVRRDLALIAAYVVALVAACRLGSTIARRRVTRRTAVWLGIAVVVAGAADLIENGLLWGVVDDPTDVEPWRIGAITSIVVAKFVLLGIAAAFGLAAVLGTILRLGRGRRQRWIGSDEPPPSRTSPLPDPKSFSLQRFEHPDGSGWWPLGATGMCWSGGGIRSASFALGALQTMHERRRLSRIDHLSTVSGGGYTGMSWQLARHAIAADRELPEDPPPLAEGSPEAEYLASEARYLWPSLYRRHGASIEWQRMRSSMSFLRATAVAVASIAFNVGLLVALLYVVARPLGWYSSSWAVADADDALRPEAWWQLPAAVGQAGIVVLGLWPALLPWWTRMASGKLCQVLAAVSSVILVTAIVWVVLVVDGPWVVSGWALLVMAGLSLVGIVGAALTRGAADQQPSAAIGVIGGVLLAVSVGLVGALGSGSGIGVPIGWVMIVGGIVVAAMWTVRTKSASGAPGYPLAFVPIGFLKLWVDSAFERGGGAAQGVVLHELDALLRIVSLLIILLLVLAACRVALTHESRCWTIGATLGVLAPVVALLGWRLTSSRLSPCWQRVVIVIAVVAAVAALSMSVRAKAPGRRMATPSLNLARLVAGVLAGILVTTATAFYLWDDRRFSIEWTHPEWVRWGGWAVLAFAVYVRLDQRWWSPHGMYKRRLAATFSPVRRSSPGERAGPLPKTVTTLSTWARRVQGGPELVVCAAAYDTDRLDPPDTQALPFEFGGRFVGSTDVGWAHTADFEQALGRRNSGDGTLHAAAAISGAAVSAAVGAVRKASLSQVIALFNLRLGVWLPSPEYVDQLGQKDVGLGRRWITKRRYTYLLKELGSRYDMEDRFIYVTDGGQLENLGLYALLVRRCSTIYAFDASGDRDDTVGALTHSMDIARRRLGMAFSAPDASDPISDAGPDFDYRKQWTTELFADLCGEEPAPPDWGRGRTFRTSSCVAFQVWYPDEDGNFAPERTGRIAYGRARLSDSANPPDVQAYAAIDAKFPSNSTADQFMDDEQFAAYVTLGRWVADRTVALID